MSKSPRDTHGPVVNTGPTAGQNRSRNNDGRWRAKRDDAGKPRAKDKGGKSGCFLTTAACEVRGLPDDCHELTVLRTFRDEVLLTTQGGREIVENYYAIAPGLVPLVLRPQYHASVWSTVQATVSAIEAGESQLAVSVYQNMVRQLQRESETHATY